MSPNDEHVGEDIPVVNKNSIIFDKVIKCFLSQDNNTAENVATILGITRAMANYYITKYLKLKYKKPKL